MIDQEAPFTQEQIDWLDARYRMSVPQLERELKEKGIDYAIERASVMAAMDQYVQQSAELPWEWGVQDCTMWVADWCVIRWGFDPAKAYRNTYSNKEGAANMATDDLVAVVGPELISMGLLLKAQPDAGYVGIVEVEGKKLAAIWSGNHWMFRTPRGIGMFEQPAIAIWGD